MKEIRPEGASHQVMENENIGSTSKLFFTEKQRTLLEPFRHIGPRLATNQALILTPSGLLPITHTLDSEIPLASIKYTLAIFEPEHCTSLESFAKRFEDERKRLADSHIVIPTYEDKILDTDRYFDHFSQGMIQLYSVADEYNDKSSLKDIDHNKFPNLKANIEQYGIIQPMIGRPSGTHMSIAWGRYILQCMKELEISACTVFPSDNEPMHFGANIPDELIRQYRRAYAQWPEEKRTKIEKSGVVTIIDCSTLLTQDLMHKPDDNTVLVNAKLIADNSNPIQSPILKPNENAPPFYVRVINPQFSKKLLQATLDSIYTPPPAKNSAKDSAITPSAANRIQPYPEIKFPRNADATLLAEARALCGAMDCRVRGHKTLGDAFFIGGVKALVMAVAEDSPSKIRGALDPKKHLDITSSLNNVNKQIQRILLLQESDVAAEEWEGYQHLQQQLLASPVLLACATGDADTIWEIRGKASGLTSDEDRRILSSTLMSKLGIALPQKAMPGAYAMLRFEERNKDLYREQEAAAVSSVGYLIEQHVIQNGYNQVQCDLQCCVSGYEIALTFGKDGSTQHEQVISLRGVRHMDDAMDILLAIENKVYGAEYAAHNIHPPLVSMPMPATSSSPPKPKVTNVNIIGNELLPQAMILLDPANIAINGGTSTLPKSSPTPGKPSAEAQVIDNNGIAALVIRSWYATRRGGNNYSTLNIPLGVKFRDKGGEINHEEIIERAQHAIRFMQDYIGINEPVSKNDLTREMEATYKDDWIRHKADYIDGYEVSRVLAFPNAEYQQRTRLSAARLRKMEMNGGMDSYIVDFSIQVKDDSIGDGKWHQAKSRGINLHTMNPELAEARGRWVMDRLVDMFENRLTQGQESPFLPDNHYWELGAQNAEGQRWLSDNSEHYTISAKPKLRRKDQDVNEAIDVSKPVLGWGKLNSMIDYFVGNFDDDLAVHTINSELKDGRMRFTLRLARATRENWVYEESASPDMARRLTNPYYRVGDNEPLAGEVMHLPGAGRADSHPVELTFEINTTGRDQQDVERLAKEFAAKVDGSVKNMASSDYRAFTMVEGNEHIKQPTCEKATIGHAADIFVDAIHSHRPPEITVARDGLNEAMEAKMSRRRGAGGRSGLIRKKHHDDHAEGWAPHSGEEAWVNSVRDSAFSQRLL